MSRDLLEFSLALGQGLNRAAQVYEQGQNRATAAEYRRQSLDVARARNTIADARYREWAIGQKVWRDRMAADTALKRAKLAGAGAAAPGASPALQSAIDSMAAKGYSLPVTPAAPNIVVEGTDNIPAPPSLPADEGSEMPVMRRGGKVKSFVQGGMVDNGTSGPGSGIGMRAGRPAGYVPGMRKGGVVKFAGGGDTRRWWDAVGGPDEYSVNRRVDVEEERARERIEKAGRTPRYGAREVESVNPLPPDWRAQPPTELHGIEPPPRADALVFTGDQGEVGAPDDVVRDPGETGGFPDPTRSQAIVTSPAGPKGRGGVAGRSGAAPARGGLRDPNRTAAFDPTADMADPYNIHAVDTMGRSRLNEPVSNTAAAVRGQPVPASGMTGGPGEGSTLSTNNVAQDMALQGGSQYAAFTFHQHQQDEHTQQGLHALFGGHGAATPPEVDAVFKSLKLPDSMPLNEKMLNAMAAVHRYYSGQGKPEIADKTAFELMQFANVMAKQHGSAAVQLIQKGQMPQAVHELLAGYNWLPNGYTAELDQSGQNIVLTGPDGQPGHSYPLNPATLKNFALGMSTGQLNWDVMRHGQQAATPTPPQAGTLPPQVTPPAAIQTQPPPTAAPAGPPPVASLASGPNPGVSKLSPAAQGPQPLQVIDTSPVAAGAPSPKQGPETDPYAVPKEEFRVTGKGPSKDQLSIYNDDDYSKDMTMLTKGLAAAPKGEKAAWNKLISLRQAGHNEKMKQRAAAEGDLNRQRSEADRAERDELTKKRRPESEETKIDTKVGERMAQWNTMSDPNFDASKRTLPLPQAAQMKERTVLGWAGPEQKRQITEAANLIWRHNNEISPELATDLALRMTYDVGDKDIKTGKDLVGYNGRNGVNGAMFIPRGPDLKGNVVVSVMHPNGRPYTVHIPRDTYLDLVDLRKQTATNAEEVHRKKIDKAKEDAAQAIRTSDLVRTLPKGADMARIKANAEEFDRAMTTRE